MKKMLLGFVFTFLFTYISLGQFAIFKGMVFSDKGKEPLVGATVRLAAQNSACVTDEFGKFELKVKPGIYNVEVSALGYISQLVYQLELSSAKPTYYEFILVSKSHEMNAVIITEDAFSRTKESPLSIHSLSAYELERMPGSALDISKTIRSLPGVSPRVSFGYNIVIRGGASNENRFYLDGIEIPSLTHFTVQGTSGGPNSIVNARMLKSAELHTGAFPSNRPNALSSVLEMTQKEGRKDRLGGSFNLGYSDWGFQLEGPMGKKSSFFFSARESYVQHVLEALGLPVIPTYSDVQYKQVYRPNDKNEITLIALGGYDKYRLNRTNNDSSEAILYNVGYIPEGNIYQYTTGIHYKHYLPKSVYSVVFSRNWTLNKAFKYRENVEIPENLLMRYQTIEAENKFRIEQKGYEKEWEWAYGVSGEVDEIRASNFSFFTHRDARIQTIDYSNRLNMLRYGLFSNLARVWGNFSLSGGIRMDANTYNEKMSQFWRQLSPRISASFQFSPQWWIHGNAGIYYQLPAYVVMMYGNQGLENQSNLDFMKSRQIVLGLEHKNQQGYQVKLEGFYKKYSQVPFLLFDSISFSNANANYVLVGNQLANSTSSGHAYGLEFQAKQQLKKNYYWMFNATYVVSEFSDQNGKWVPSAWDNRYFSTLSFGKVFSKNWQVGLRYGYAGGNPYTPYDIALSSQMSVWDINQRGVFDYANQLNQARLPGFGQFDLRVDKTFHFNKKSLNLFIDLANANRSSLPAVPYLILERDANHQPVLAGNGQYKTKLINADTGRMISTFGIMFDF